MCPRVMFFFLFILLLQRLLKIVYNISGILLIKIKVWFLYQWCYFVSLSCMSAAGLDMSLMLWWACMLSSHFSPQNFSTVTLCTVPGSKQCGATPGEETTTRDSSLMCVWTQQAFVSGTFQWQLGFSSSIIQNTGFQGWFPDVTVLINII